MNKKILITVILLLCSSYHVHGKEVLDLAGSWGVQLDPKNEGIENSWYSKKLAAEIDLPGSTDEAGLGDRQGAETALMGHLTRAHKYSGSAWYNREIDVPSAWVGKPIELFLERVHTVSDLWINGKKVGSRDTLSAAHRFDVTDFIQAGRNKISLRVTNEIDVDLGQWSHSASDETLTNWNGVVGRMELRAYPDQYLDNVRVGSDLSAGVIWADGLVKQLQDKQISGELILGLVDIKSGKTIDFTQQKISLHKKENSFRIELPLPQDVKLWDEFSPNLYQARIRVSTSGNRHEESIRFGVREITTKGTQFVINGRPTFMRGNLHCGAFPLTGYFSTEREYWEKIINTSKEYGVNHFRFHTYNPPHIAYQVADELGFYFCTEGPFWSKFKGGTPEAEYMKKEAFRMIEEFGNYASFVMMGLGNEVGGDNAFLSGLIKELKDADPRRLYNCDVNEPGSGKRKEPIEEVDFFVSRWTKTKGTMLRLLGGRFRNHHVKYGTMENYSTSVDDVSMPLLAHELGQYVVHPSFEEIPKYTGVLQPYNLKHFKHILELNGLGDQLLDLGYASGRLSAQLYREDMEMCLRTPGMGGYQLLQLQDFPGQGDALIGMLDIFWDSKGFITPEEFRQSNSETTLLAMFKNFVWDNSQTFSAHVKIANYGPSALDHPKITWSLARQDGQLVASGTLSKPEIPTGNLYDVGKITFPLHNITEATQLDLSLSLEGTEFSNSYPIWVYPKNQDVAIPEDVIIVQRYNQKAKNHLAKGGKVLLSLSSGQKFHNYPRIVQRAFRPVFWNYMWLNNRNFGGNGLLVDADHPALKDFPTDTYSSWQWSGIINGSHTFVLNELPDAYRPIVQEIDDFHRGWKMGTLLEGKVGKGKILITGFDLHKALQNRKVAAQMRASLLNYMASDAFQPEQELDVDLFFEKSIAANNQVLFASSSIKDAGKGGPRGELEIIQGELNEFNGLSTTNAAAEGAGAAFDLNWRSEWYMDATSLPQEVHVDLGRVAALNGILYKPSNRKQFFIKKFDVYVKSAMEDPWGEPVLEHIQRQEKSSWFRVLPFKKVMEGRYIKVVVKEGIDQESRVLGVGDFEPWFQ